MNNETDFILIRLPRSHWQQIVNDIADMAGTSECEILSQIEEESRYYHYHVCSDGKCWNQRGHH